jgi:predicted nucleic acid-binding protein
MASPISLFDPALKLITDTSAIINLNASGFGKEILSALPNRLAVVDIVRSELEFGRSRGRRDAGLLEELLKAGLVEIVTLKDEGERRFEELVVGAAAATLDDGEAATIAYALSSGGVAVIDEGKASRICAERFPVLAVARTVDIFGHPEVRRGLGDALLADAVFNALTGARMRVFPDHVPWVVNLIGHDRAAQCRSLPSSVRQSQMAAGPEKSCG